MNSNPSEPGRTSPQLPAPFPCQWWVWPVTGGHAWPCTDVPFPRGWEVSWVPTRGSARPPADTSKSDTAYCYPKPWGSAPPLCYWQPQTPPAEQSLPPFLAQAPTSGSWQRGCSFPAKRPQSCERLPSSPRAFLTEQAQSRTSVLWQEILHSLLPRLAGRLPAYSSARLRRPGCRPRGDTALLRHHTTAPLPKPSDQTISSLGLRSNLPATMTGVLLGLLLKPALPTLIPSLPLHTLLSPFPEYDSKQSAQRDGTERQQVLEHTSRNVTNLKHSACRNISLLLLPFNAKIIFKHIIPLNYVWFCF